MGNVSADQCFGLRGGRPESNEAGSAFPSPADGGEASKGKLAQKRSKAKREMSKKKEVLKQALKEMQVSGAAVMDGEASASSSIEHTQTSARKPKVERRKPEEESKANLLEESAGDRVEESEASTEEGSSESQLSRATTYFVGSDAKIVGLSFRDLPPRTPVVVDKIHPGTWASTTDIAPGDELVGIEDRDVEEMQRDEFMQLMTRRPLHLSIVKDPELDAAENEFFPDSFSPRKSVCFATKGEAAAVFDIAANDGPRRHSCV